MYTESMKQWIPSVLLLILSLLLSSCSGEGGSSGLIAVYGDSRTNHNIHRKIAYAISSASPIAVFHTGDMVHQGAQADQWDLFVDIISPITRQGIPFYPALGNHDYPVAIFLNLFNLPNNEEWYSVDIGNIHFIILNNYESYLSGSPQYLWLENDLQNVPAGTSFTVVLFHVPPYNTGRHMGEQPELRTDLVPLFELYHVDLVLNGHDHNYEKTLHNGIYYIVTGGGGAPLYEQAGADPESLVFIRQYHYCLLVPREDALTVEAYDLDNNLMDRTEIPGAAP